MSYYWITVLACLVGIAYAGYGGVAPQDPVAYQPPASYYPPVFVHSSWRHGRHRDSRSRSRSDSKSSSESRESREHGKKCKRCKRLEEYKLEGPTTVPAHIEYFTPKHGCRRAIISCPFNSNNYFMVVESGSSLDIIGTGNRFQRVARCNKNGKFEASPIHDKPREFSKVACVVEMKP